jgi:ATP-dependent helicase/nuclease subunit A
LGGAKVTDQAIDPTDPQATQAALDYGTQMHRLLEVLPALPRSDWPDRIAALVPDQRTHSELLDTLGRLCATPEIAALLNPSPPARCLIEVGLTAPVEGGQIIGLVDRLIITPDKIIAVDFKTNRDVPATVATVPEGLLRQMGAYRAALLVIWPDRLVETALIWTSTAQLMMLPSAMVEAALTRSGLDANRVGS